MDNLDIKKLYKQHYDASLKSVSFVHIEKIRYLMLDGTGNPEETEFKEKSVALRLLLKEIKKYFKSQNITYTVPPIEGLWDTYNNEHYDVSRKERIRYTLLAPLINGVSDEVVNKCIQFLLVSCDNPYVIDIYTKEFEEGNSVQMLHKGPYNTEINTTTELMEYITIENFKLKGMHHEIYLNNPLKVKKEDLKTIIRYAIEDA